MPLPVVTNGYQTTLIWTSASSPRQATNHLRWVDTVGTQTPAQLFTDLDTAVTAAMWDAVGGTSTRVERVRVTPLDGISASSEFITVGTKWGSGSAGDPILQGAAVVSLKTGSRLRAGRGRVYLPWISETNQAAGVLSSAQVTAMQTGWSTMLTTMVTLGWQLGVVNYPNGTPYSVTSILVRPYLKTQRRRSRR